MNVHARTPDAAVPEAVTACGTGDLPVDAVRALLADLVAPLAVEETEALPLQHALGRVLAQDVISPVNVPPHDNAAMDGYAFDGALLACAGDGPLALRVAGTALAGRAWQGALAPGDALRIMTGAVMPPGLDTVVPQELCVRDGDTARFAAQALHRGANRRRAGEDLVQGAPALRRGEILSAAALGLLASLGLPTATVRRRLRVAYFSTGDELLGPGEAPREGAIFDSNRASVLALLERLGCDTVDLGCVRDDPAALEAALRRAAAGADAIVTSGGVSVGAADHTREVMERLGDMAFWQVAMRPGRPMAAGRIPRTIQAESASSAHAAGADSYEKYSNPLGNDVLLFGLPGNPVAAMVSFLVFVRPALLQMMGCHAAAAALPPLLRARSAAAIRKRPGRTEYQRGLVQAGADGRPEVRIAGHQGSGVLSSMLAANAFVVLHHDQGPVAAGDEVDVMVFHGIL